MWSRRAFLGLGGAVGTGAIAARPFSGLARLEAATAAVADRTPEEVAQDEFYWREIQDAFTLDRTLINLNNGNTCPSPRVVLEATKRYMDMSNMLPVHYRSDIERHLQTVRRGLAKEFGFDEDEVDLPAGHRDPCHRHAHRVTDAERAAGVPAAQQVVHLVVLVEVVAQRAHVHQPLDEHLVQLDEEAEPGDAADDPVVFLTDLVLHELDSLQLQDLALGVHCHPLAARRLLGDGGEIGGDSAMARARKAQETMRHQVGIAPDR